MRGMSNTRDRSNRKFVLTPMTALSSDGCGSDTSPATSAIILPAVLYSRSWRTTIMPRLRSSATTIRVPPDAMTERIKRCADEWKRGFQHFPICNCPEQVRADRIDIFVDLSVHLAGNRLLAFARKPAPVQVTWLGYPGSSGLEVMDYRLSDPYLDPPGISDGISMLRRRQCGCRTATGVMISMGNIRNMKPRI